MIYRSCTIGDISVNQENTNVKLSGWVQKYRDLGSIVFVWLRDRTGLIQVLFNEENFSKENFAEVKKIRSEYVISVNGIVKKREESAINHNLKNGDIEIFANDFSIINKASTPPIYIDDNADESETVRLKYRYLDLRKPKMQQALIFRHQVIKSLREYVDSQGFVEIETPIFTKSTPEGARDYLVPCRVNPGEFYALPQSPQIYKQLLMVAGMDKYYQVARCFRDEDGRADRQPEFTQFDMEMSFIEQKDIQCVVEGAFKNVFKQLMNIEFKDDFPRITWQQAMEEYGSDKPDTRFDMKIKNISDCFVSTNFEVFKSCLENNGIICALTLENQANIARKAIDKLQDFVKEYHVKGLSWIKIESDGNIKSSLSKVLSNDEIEKIIKNTGLKKGDILFIIADKKYIALTAMGQLRLKLAKDFDLIPANKYNLLWVTEFPLLEWSEDDGRYVAMHHPFTSPMAEDFELMETEPGKVRANAYDLVLNGVEMGSGSIRIHDSALQERMFNLLGMSKDEAWTKFGFLLEAFKYGTPPHGGFAFGIDRLIMCLLNSDSLRDVIAFPKIQNGKCLMMSTPSSVSAEQLDVLNLNIVNKENTNEQEK